MADGNNVLSWLKDLIGSVTTQEAVDFHVTPALSVDGAMPAFAPLVPEASYVVVRVKSLRLPFTRKLTSRLYGVVHSFANLPGGPGEAVQFATATTPAALQAMDPKNASNVIVVDRTVAGPTPWHGGDCRLQIGLFSVVEQELAGPFLATLTSLSEKAGVSLITGAKPFLDVISAGVGALSRQTGSVKLEIGLDRTFSPPVPGHYAVVAAPTGALAGKRFDLDGNDGKLKVDGVHYTDRPYLVFTIEAVDRQDGWGQIEELRKAYALVTQAVRANDQAKAREAMTGFRLLAMSSPDLILGDATRLVALVDDMLKAAFGKATVSLTARKPAEPPSFEALKLY